MFEINAVRELISQTAFGNQTFSESGGSVKSLKLHAALRFTALRPCLAAGLPLSCAITNLRKIRAALSFTKNGNDSQQFRLNNNVGMLSTTIFGAHVTASGKAAGGANKSRSSFFSCVFSASGFGRVI